MSVPPAKSDRWNQETWDRLENAVEQFEKAWKSGPPPAIEAYLNVRDAERPKLLVELALVDLECRIKAGESARVERYFERFAELAEDRRAALQLIASEFKLRRRREPGLDLAEYLQRFPQFRADLAESLPGPHARKAEPPRPPSSQCVGQFELLETVGQGAFGTVYRARDSELNRIVAVKVPRGDRSRSPADEDRFVREARNAAQLSHPGIVPVYEVGHDAAVPYIVSAFVQGSTLADASKEQRLEFRQVADLVAQVAEALDHAHQNGVVHRDLKPSNIMLGRIEGSGVRSQESGVRNQESGVGTRESGVRSRESGVVDGRAPRLHAFVMDFGLARREDGDIRLTMEGQIVGTPAYMSPEQARGENNRVDARSDLFSLGVILYEQLTGELPFRGVTRMLLQQIIEEEPRPPRRLNDKIPRDLETIALKCMAKEPARRYPTAGALAEDLRRHLAGVPILARPIGPVERLERWAKRNPRVAILSAAVLLLLVTVAAGGTTASLVISAQKSAESKAREEAERSAESARKHLAVALDALDKLVNKVQEEMQDQPALVKLKEEVLGDALAGLKRVAAVTEGSEADPTLRSAHLRLGDLYLLLGNTADARQHYEQCQTIARRLRDSDPQRTDHRRALCIVTAKLGEASLRSNDLTAAKGFCHEAVRMADELVASEPNDLSVKRDLALCYNRLGRVQVQRGEPRAAADSYARQVELDRVILEIQPGNHDVSEDLATANDQLGDTRLSLGMTADAREAYEAALDLRLTLARARPESARVRRELALSYEKLGDIDLRTDARAAVKSYRQAFQLREKLAAEAPRNSFAQRDLSIAHARLGEAAEALRDRQEARVQFEKALERMDGLAKEYPGDVQLQRDRAVAHLRLGRVNLHLGEFAAAREHFQKALEDFEQVSKADSANVPAKVDLAACYGNCGNVEKVTKNFARAAKHFEAGVAVLQALEDAGKLAYQPAIKGWLGAQQQDLETCKDVMRAIDDLDYALTKPPKLAVTLLHERALALANKRQYAELATTAEKLRGLAPEDRDTLYDLACFYALCVPAVADGKPDGQLTPEESELRKKYLAGAIAALTASIERGYKNVKHMESDTDLAAIRATVEYRQLVRRLKGGPPRRH